MKKTILFTLLILAMLLAACGAETETPVESPADPTAQPEIEEVEQPAEAVSVGVTDPLVIRKNKSVCVAGCGCGDLFGHPNAGYGYVPKLL